MIRNSYLNVSTRLWGQRLRIKAWLILLSLNFLVLSYPENVSSEPEVQALTQVKEEARSGNYKLITPRHVRKRFLEDSSSLLLVDTRQEWEYQLEHIKGAVSLPVTPSWWTQYSHWARAEMKKLLGPDKKRQVVFY